MDDLVKRLRNILGDTNDEQDTIFEAADEIERLAREVERITMLRDEHKQNAVKAIVALHDVRRERDAMRDALKIVDDDVRHHLRSNEVAAALLRPHAVQAVRDALSMPARANGTQELTAGSNAND